MNELVGEYDQEWCNAPSSASMVIEELYLGDGCTIVLEIRQGVKKVLLDEKRAIEYWMEISIRNNEILENVIPQVARICGLEHIIIVEDKSNEWVWTTREKLLAEFKETFKQLLFGYREQLIEFIKQQS